ncbi:hypothetical protein Csa_005661, partial [Cucumis sativus]
LWSLEPSGSLLDEFLTVHLASSSNLDSNIFNAIRKTKIHKTTNIFVDLLNGNLNSTDVHKKLRSQSLVPSVNPLCYKTRESLSHILFECVFSNPWKENVHQLLFRDRWNCLADLYGLMWSKYCFLGFGWKGIVAFFSSRLNIILPSLAKVFIR